MIIFLNWYTKTIFRCRRLIWKRVSVDKETTIMSNSFHEKFARDIKTSRERELPFVRRIKEKLDKEFMGGFPPAKINWFAVFFTCLTTLEALCKSKFWVCFSTTLHPSLSLFFSVLILIPRLSRQRIGYWLRKLRTGEAFWGIKGLLAYSWGGGVVDDFRLPASAGALNKSGIIRIAK